MVVVLEGSEQVIIPVAERDRLKALLHEMKEHRQEQIRILQQRVERYEKKRQAEEALYKKMGSIRKLWVGKRPEHHLAVEYMVYVKRPLQEIEGIHADIKKLEEMLQQLDQSPSLFFVPHHLTSELERKYRKFI